MRHPSAAVYATTVIAGIPALRSEGDLTSAQERSAYQGSKLNGLTADLR